MDGTTGAVAVDGERRQLVNVAYRLLGSATEAEDAVQDAYARWYGLPSGRREEIESPGAWLTTVTGRICLDLLGSARARRERYVGVWLPEPLPDRTEWDHGGQGVLTTGSMDPAGSARRRARVSGADTLGVCSALVSRTFVEREEVVPWPQMTR